MLQVFGGCVVHVTFSIDFDSVDVVSRKFLQLAQLCQKFEEKVDILNKTHVTGCAF